MVSAQAKKDLKEVQQYIIDKVEADFDLKVDTIVGDIELGDDNEMIAAFLSKSGKAYTVVIEKEDPRPILQRMYV